MKSMFLAIASLIALQASAASPNGVYYTPETQDYGATYPQALTVITDDKMVVYEEHQDAKIAFHYNVQTKENVFTFSAVGFRSGNYVCNGHVFWFGNIINPKGSAEFKRLAKSLELKSAEGTSVLSDATSSQVQKIILLPDCHEQTTWP